MLQSIMAVILLLWLAIHQMYVDALVVRDGKIVFVGASDKAMEVAGKGHIMIDLKGKTLSPWVY